jgi:hypothetical protein
MAVGGLCHVPASLPLRRSPDTQAGWKPGSVSTSSSDCVNFSFWANYILYSLLPNTNILTPHLQQPGQERSDSNLCCIARTAYLITVLPTTTEITMLHKHVHMITTMQLWYDTVFMCEGKKWRRRHVVKNFDPIKFLHFSNMYYHIVLCSYLQLHRENSFIWHDWVVDVPIHRFPDKKSSFNVDYGL